MANTTATIPMTARDNSRGRGAVRVWLYVIALMIVAIVVVGGATRLTESGLSITEWKPIHGVIPPLNDADWQEEFAKYRQIPEFALNPDMTLDGFKRIFWWEWAHRFLGRLIGVAFLVPFVFFLWTRRIERPLVPKLVAIFVLGGLQGAIGWWMVASGLAERTDVSQYRLAVHLILACVILAYVLWVAAGIGGEGRERGPARLRRGARLIVGLVLLQIFLGGLVAGLNAGLTFNTWPLMDGALIPSGLFIQSPAWSNLFENALTVQFNHRMIAYLLLAVVFVHAFQARGTASARSAISLLLLVVLQAAVGITALLQGVPLGLALVHQLGAVALLSVAVLHLRVLSPHARLTRPTAHAGA